jgi:hypothetical protein
LVLLALVALYILDEHFTERVVVDAEFEGRKETHVKRVKSETVVH